MTVSTGNPSPKVSVIIPVHDTEPYLERCVQSVMAQTIGVGNLEIIAVDDGSTDGSGALLDRLGASCSVLTVIHQAASGGPSRPRNVGLDHASGEFVFFLDSDDRLGTEALERMVAMAERNGSDVVLGKTVSPNGRFVAPEVFRHSQADADLFTSAVYRALNPLKLFRRSLVERLGLRFPEDVRVGEDQPFVAHAYLHARAISVVADYDCYHWTRREDGESVTQRGIDYLERLPQTEQVIELVAAHAEPGPGRDHLVTRHLRLEVLRRLNSRFLAMPPEERRRLTAEIRSVLDRWLTDDVRRRLDVPWKLRAYCVQHDLFDELLEIVRIGGADFDLVAEDGHLYFAHPLFRAGAIPDECFDKSAQRPVKHFLDAVEREGTVVTLRGSATRPADVDQRVELVLREWTTGQEYRTPARESRFEVDLDLATAAGGRPLPPGLWDVSVAVTAHGTTKEARLGSKRADDLDTAAQTWKMRLGGDTPVPVTAYYTDPYGNLTFDVADTRRGAPAGAITVDGVALEGASTLVVNGRHTAGRDSGSRPAGAVTARLTTSDGILHEVAATAGDGGRFTVALPLDTVADGGPLPAGRWAVTLHTRLGGLGHTVRVPPTPNLTASWRRDGRRHDVNAVTVGRPPGLALHVTVARAARLSRLRLLRPFQLRGRTGGSVRQP